MGRRGQTFDFRVNVPSRKQPPAALGNMGSNSASGVAREGGKDEDKNGIDFDDQSLCSTMAPSSHHTARMSSASSSTSTMSNSMHAPYVPPAALSLEASPG